MGGPESELGLELGALPTLFCEIRGSSVGVSE